MNTGVRVCGKAFIQNQRTYLEGKAQLENHLLATIITTAD